MFLNDWKDGGIDEMISDFEISVDTLEHAEVLLASYGREHGYDGGAFVLYRESGKLYEVNAGHCSCYGLEEQWEPEETDKEALLHRLDEGDLGEDGDHRFFSELRSVLETL